MPNASKNECIQKRFWWKWIYTFLIKNEKLLDKYDEIWHKVRKALKKGFDSEPVYHDKFKN